MEIPNEGTYMHKGLVKLLEDKFVDRLITPELLSGIQHQVLEFLIDNFKKVQMKHIKFKVVQDEKLVKLQPENFYTALILCGVLVTYEDVARKKEYKTAMGTYKWETGVLFFYPTQKENLEMIE